MVSSEPVLKFSSLCAVSLPCQCSEQEAHDGEVAALTFSPDGYFIATGGADKVVKIWNIRPTEGVVKNRGIYFVLEIVLKFA